jgi:hypothetical protein
VDYSSPVADPDARIDAKNRDFARFEQVKGRVPAGGG